MMLGAEFLRAHVTYGAAQFVRVVKHGQRS